MVLLDWSTRRRTSAVARHPRQRAGGAL